MKRTSAQLFSECGAAADGERFKGGGKMGSNQAQRNGGANLRASVKELK